MSSHGERLWYKLGEQEIANILHTDYQKGLFADEVAIRQRKHGRNQLTKERELTLFDRALTQLKSPLSLLLFLAGVTTIFLHEYVDASVIFAALVINVVIGVAQEGRAAKAFEKLSESQEAFAIVTRDGERRKISARDIVPGDMVHLEAGAYVPADMRIIYEKELSVNESALTGEWVDVDKNVDVITKNVPIVDQANMAWMGTFVTGGIGYGTAVATGNRTQIGKIAESLAHVEEGSTPLQHSIQKLTNFLTKVILAAIVGIVAIGLFRDYPIKDMALLATAIAVAAIPVGFPAAVTVVLALGMESILKRGGLVRNLLAAETLGSTTIILTDKTGTLTEAKMSVASVATGLTYNADRGVSEKGGADARYVLMMAISAGDAFVEGTKDPLSPWIVHGRPIDRAVTYAGLEQGIMQTELFRDMPRLDYLPFSSEYRFAASLHKTQRGNVLIVSGAPEPVLSSSSAILKGGNDVHLLSRLRDDLERFQEKRSSEGMRIIGVGYKKVDWVGIPRTDSKNFPQTLLGDLVFGGFILFHDPIRPDVKNSIKTAQKAGCRVIMMTGDHKSTARTIASETGICEEGEYILMGNDIETYDDKTLLEKLKHTCAFARVVPQQKLRIARLLKQQEETVAMTGDGVNDAPALREASIGIAIGSGTEVAKEASDLILLNNSFSIIVHAIEEGRRILDNIKKIAAYLLSTSFSEIVVVSVAFLAGTPIPLLPTQILWIKIIEEGPMNFSFAFEPKEDDVMERNPRDMRMRTVLTAKLKKLIMLIAVITSIFLVALYFFLLSIEMPIEKIRTIMFIALAVDSMFFAFSIKNLHKPIWRIPLASNRYLLLALLVSSGLLSFPLFIAPLREILSLAPLAGIEFFVLGIGVVNLIIIEVIKYFVFRRVAH